MQREEGGGEKERVRQGERGWRGRERGGVRGERKQRR